LLRVTLDLVLSVYFQLNKIEEAETEFRKGLKYAPEYKLLKNNLNQCEVKKKKVIDEKLQQLWGEEQIVLELSVWIKDWLKLSKRFI